MIFKNSQEAFRLAIQQGRLSDNPASALYAGHYMYMGTQENGVDEFKNINTRDYLPSKKSLADIDVSTKLKG